MRPRRTAETPFPAPLQPRRAICRYQLSDRMRPRLFHLLTAVLLGTLAGTAKAQDTPVSRTLRVIDFEERRLGNGEELPMHWSKLEGAPFPHYVNARLARGRARSGRYTFRFDLNGGSLAYRYDPGHIKVQPRAHYRVETHVQTTVLTHARARLTAYFVDIDGRTIERSIRHAELYSATRENEGWKHLEVELSAGHDAQWLVIELGLLQPAMYGDETLGRQTLFPQDIRGTAWFDDVVVSQVPKVRMTTDRPGNIFRRGETLGLEVVVNDRSTDDLAAQLVIRDAAGKDVYQRSGALDLTIAENEGPGQKRMKLLLPPLSPGWYRAGLVMTSQGQFVGREQLDLVLLADDAPHARPDERFGIIATELPFEGWAELPEILPFLAAGRVKLAVWNRYGDIQQHDPAGFDQLLMRLQELLITPTACITALPPNVARRAGGDRLIHLLSARLEDWQPQLSYTISRHATKLDRWQLGDDGTDAFVNEKAMRDVYGLVYGEFAKLVQGPDLAMPWPAWYELEGQMPATIALSAPPSILPHQLPLYMQEFKRHEGHNLSLSLQVLDREQYGRDVQIRDMAQRMIYALSADARRLDIPLPFTVRREEDRVVRQPQEMLMIMRTIITTLGGAHFRGRVPIADGVEAFLFERGGQGILALWNRHARAGIKQLNLVLGDRPRAIDLWGNVTPLLRPRDAAPGHVQFALGEMPVFLVDIDSALAQLRASVAMDRPLIESAFMAHRRKLRFVNPYRQSISGSVKLKAPAGWTVSPPTMTFSINPGETFERDITLEFPYNSYAGAKTIDAQFVLQADRPVSMTVPITLMLGLSDVGMQTLALREAKDVVVQQFITNYGQRPIDYTSFAIFPGQARQERLVTNLGPGRTTVKTYRFNNVEITPQMRIRTGVKELRGTRILNDEVEIK